jgi:ATP-dependent helicase HrpA
MTVFLEGREPLRNGTDFEARIATTRGGIDCRRRKYRRPQAALRAARASAGGLAPAGAPTAADIRAQLAVRLTPAGFLLVTPWERLKDYPRYFQALEQRLEKSGLDARRDAKLAAEIAPQESRYRERVKAERGARPPGEDEFRWLLEEFRVSLFAQQLKTRVPVSARRLEDAWAERTRATVV